MHELSVCQALIDQLANVAAARRASRVTAVGIRIGVLSGIVPELLERAFPLASAGTLADNADLQMESAPVRVYCAECDKESDAAPSRLVCGFCANWRTRLVSGDELFLTRVELEYGAEESLHV